MLLGMKAGKDGQLQIRLSAAEKKAIRQAAARAGMDMSSWVRARLLPRSRETFRHLAERLSTDDAERPYLLAELNDLLARLSPAELVEAVAEPPPPLEPYMANYLAAMVETAAHRAGVKPPSWTSEVVPLAEPAFGNDLPGLRLHLLLNAPPAFRRRNIFIDSSVGDRI
jgi:uncharacterized protein (DUF1778 family)